MLTHDHRGRPLSPAMSSLLSTTVIPVRRKRMGESTRSSSLSSSQRIHGSVSSSGSSSLSIRSLEEDDEDGDVEDDTNSDEEDDDDDDDLNFDIENDDNVIETTVLTSEKAALIMDGEFGYTSEDESDGSNRRGGRRNLVDLPVEEVTDHPLSAFEESDEYEEVDGQDGEEEEEEDKSATKTFVESLASSLKSMASSFKTQEKSMFAFSPRSTDEPIPSSSISVSRGSAHMHEQAAHQPTPTEALPSTPTKNKKRSINLKTYAVETTLIPHLRPREIRMNSDFYRIYAVETLMKKNGKLNTDFQGRATMILEPRTDICIRKEDEDNMFGGIRKRFENGKQESCRISTVNASDTDAHQLQQPEEDEASSTSSTEDLTSPLNIG